MPARYNNSDDMSAISGHIQNMTNGPETRSRIAAALGVKPYSGYFNRTLLDLLNSKQIIFGQKAPTGRNRLLQLADKTNPAD